MGSPTRTIDSGDLFTETTANRCLFAPPTMPVSRTFGDEVTSFFGSNGFSEYNCDLVAFKTGCFTSTARSSALAPLKTLSFDTQTPVTMTAIATVA